MGFWDFLQPTAKNCYNKPLVLRMRDVNHAELLNCRIGDKVNFWSKPHLPEVSIYPARSYGGGPALGYVPRKFRTFIRDHILKNGLYKAIIIDKAGTIEFVLRQ